MLLFVFSIFHFYKRLLDFCFTAQSLHSYWKNFFTITNYLLTTKEDFKYVYYLKEKYQELLKIEYAA